MKQKPSLITSPPVTLDEIARTFKISKKRRKELEQLVLETEAKMARKALLAISQEQDQIQHARTS